MKNIINSLKIILIAIIFMGCSKDGDKISQPNNPPASTVSFKGNFVNSAHPTSGMATVNLDKTKLSLNTFKTDAGPNLNIYLASNLIDINADYKDLGDIKGVNGNYTYDIPANTNLTTYKYVVVWCIDFDVNFGYATLAP